MKLFKSKKNRIIIIAVAVLVIVLIILAVNKGRNQGAIRVTAEKAEKRTVIESVSANGKIQPELDVKISPYISGEVVGLYVEEGDRVKKGDLLAKIDPQIYIANFEQAKASLNGQKANEANSRARVAQVEAQFENAKLSYERNKKLWNQQVISQSDYDAAESAYKVAKAEVDAAKETLKSAEFGVASSKALLDQAQENLTKTTIVAPSDGTVSKLSVESGERVTGASQFSSGTEIMRIANLDVMEVNVEVSENDIVRVALDDTCLIEVDAYLDRKFKGLVTEIATSANTTGTSADQVTNFDVKIRILRDSYKDLITDSSKINSPFRPGMSATVEIQTATVHDKLTVPIQAVTVRKDTTGVVATLESNIEAPETDQSMKEYVFLYDNGIAKMQEVKTGIQDNTYIVITSGLDDGQEVITGPYRAISKQLKNGDEVKKVDKKFLFSEEK